MMASPITANDPVLRLVSQRMIGVQDILVDLPLEQALVISASVAGMTVGTKACEAEDRRLLERLGRWMTSAWEHTRGGRLALARRALQVALCDADALTSKMDRVWALVIDLTIDQALTVIGCDAGMRIATDGDRGEFQQYFADYGTQVGRAIKAARDAQGVVGHA